MLTAHSSSPPPAGAPSSDSPLALETFSARSHAFFSLSFFSTSNIGASSSRENHASAGRREWCRPSPPTRSSTVLTQGAPSKPSASLCSDALRLVCVGPESKLFKDDSTPVCVVLWYVRACVATLAPTTYPTPTGRCNAASPSAPTCARRGAALAARCACVPGCACAPLHPYTHRQRHCCLLLCTYLRLPPRVPPLPPAPAVRYTLPDTGCSHCVVMEATSMK